MGISRVLAKWVTNYSSPQSFGTKLRAKRIAPLLNMIEAIFNEKGAVNVIDLGGTEQYWSIIPRQYLIERNVNITIINLQECATHEESALFRFIEADACNLSEIADDSFDIAHSNSVIEHVGDWGRMRQFANEISRIAKNYFVQTPSYWFPIEPHCMALFFHWLPEPLRVFCVMHFQLGHWRRAKTTNEAVEIVQSARLLDRKMFRELFPGALILTEKLFLLPKSFVAIRNQKVIIQ